MGSKTTNGSSSGINRRAVVAGAAWAVPAVLVASAVPAMAASGSPPTLVLKKACKLPGNRCHIPAAKQAYKFNFDVTNNSPYTIYICDATFSLTGTSVDPLVWVPPVGGCLTVPPNTPTPVNINIFAVGSNSANLTFTTVMTLQWAHACPCSADPHVPPHPNLTYTITVSGTAPDCVTCLGPT